MKKIFVVSLVTMLLVSGCSEKDKEVYQDSGRTGVDNQEKADLVRMPDGFSNVATKCDHGNRVYVLYHHDSPYGGIDVVPQDKTCAS